METLTRFAGIALANPPQQPLPIGVYDDGEHDDKTNHERIEIVAAAEQQPMLS
ncbi:hypothetical protein [Mesorhizobium sp. WSM4906]|uniref:hypothetical protein n=1 Tax=Mesorhizobium sp. WSM4906 TaxID=3038546 RepID=UPI00241725E2|nr:hypothetical protein [Mesorhizobium sp. WSM4906]WFP77070.1 hypothetical protein QAZ22_04260 [Mesorhizobium sp. WSM4906]